MFIDQSYNYLIRLDIGKALGQYFKVQAAKSETTKLEAFGRFKSKYNYINYTSIIII